MLSRYKDKIVAVRGNCEAEVDQMVLPFPCMADYALLIDGGITFYLTHGHHASPDNLPPLEEGSIFLSGHTHIYTAYEKEGIYFCNPGSVSIPKGGNPPTYGLLEDNVFSIHTADGNTIASIQAE